MSYSILCLFPKHSPIALLRLLQLLVDVMSVRCHFGLRCVGCGENTKRHQGNLNVVVYLDDGSQKVLSVCKTAKLLISRMGFSTYKSVTIYQNRMRAGRFEETNVNADVPGDTALSSCIQREAVGGTEAQITKQPEVPAMRCLGRIRDATKPTCYYTWQCIGCRPGITHHKSTFRVVLPCTSDGTEKTVALCKTAKVLMERMGYDNYVAMVTGIIQAKQNTRKTATQECGQARLSDKVAPQLRGPISADVSEVPLSWPQRKRVRRSGEAQVNTA